MMRSFVLALAAVAVPAATVVGQTPLYLTLQTTVNVSSTANPANPQFIGSNPSAMAWNGTHLWLGGYNASGATANTSVVRVSNALTAPTIENAFGAVSSPNTRGITSLAVSGTTLAVALDLGAGNANSVRAFDVSTPSPSATLWQIGAAAGDSGRRGNGVAFDPGFNTAAAGQGVAFLNIGGGRRLLLNSADGTYVASQNSTDGFIINHTGGNTTWRDLTFDPATGDMYAREQNRLIKGVRTGDQSFTQPLTIVNTGLTAANTIDNQNITFADLSGLSSEGNPGTKTVFLNDRAVGTSGQSLGSVVKAFDTNGNPIALNFFGINASAVTGNGAYDFSYDAGTQTLAISDFSTRNVYIFNVTPAPEPAGLLALAGLAAVGLRAVRRRRAA